MINWREKFIATGIHFTVTLVFASIAAAVIFFVWFPAPLDTMVGGTRLFLLVVGCDLALGPLLSLIAYNSRKTRLALTVDYTVIGVCQMAALIYGVYVAAGTRPVYIAFNGDRYEIVSARDISDKELALAKKPEYGDLPWTGPRIIAVNVPPEDQQDALFESLGGNEEHQRPKFFVPIEDKLDVIRAKSKSLKELADKFPASKPLLDAAVAEVGMPEDELAWLPVRHLMGFWTAVIRRDDGKPVAWVDFDPYG